jgi:hypothetical protein
VPREIACRRCSAPIILVREVDSPRYLALNPRPVEGGTVVLAPDGRTATVVPAGRGALHSLHACEGGR